MAHPETRPPPSLGSSRAQSGDLDPDSRAWLRDLGGSERARRCAIGRLHALLLDGARFELARRGQRRAGDFDDLAMQAADDALMRVLGKVHTYRGDSRFTTWATKFAVLEAAAHARRHAWRNRQLPQEIELRTRFAMHAAAPDADAETAELLAALPAAIADGLTAHQRTVLVALTLDDVPIDVLAERLGTTRGALYKTLHDARVKLRARLARSGLHVGTPGEHRSLAV